MHQLDILDRKKMRKDVLTLVQTILTRKGYHGTVWYGWWDSFCNRHPDISLTKPELLAHPHVICNTLEIINKCFDLLDNKWWDNITFYFVSTQCTVWVLLSSLATTTLGTVGSSGKPDSSQLIFGMVFP